MDLSTVLRLRALRRFLVLLTMVGLPGYGLAQGVVPESPPADPGAETEGPRSDEVAAAPESGAETADAEDESARAEDESGEAGAAAGEATPEATGEPLPAPVELAPAPPPLPPPVTVIPDPETIAENTPVAVDYDHRLRDALLDFFETRDRGARADRLAAFESLTDPGTVVALDYVARHDDSVGVAARAVEVLGQLTLPAADVALDGLARGPVRDGVWEAAIRALGDHPTPARGDLLYAIAADTEVQNGRRSDATGVLRDTYPELLATRGQPRLSGSRLLPAVAGAGIGGYTLFTVGTFSAVDSETGDQDSTPKVIGALGGILIGGTGGFLLGQDVPTNTSAWYASAIGWGLFHGLTIPVSINDDIDDRAFFASGVAGEAVGAGFAWLTLERLHWDLSDMAFVNINGIAGWVLGWGIYELVGNFADREPGFVMTSLFNAAALVGSGFATRSATFSSGDVGLAALGVWEGGWFGGFAPSVIEQERRGLGGMLTGAVLGLALGEGLGQVTDYTAGDVGQMLALASYGKALGAGLSLLGEADPTIVHATQLSVGLAGLVAGALGGHLTSYDDGDLVMVPVATAIGLWHGLALAGFIDHRVGLSGERFGGLALTLPAVFGLGTLAVSQAVAPSPMAVGMGSLGAVWGAWFAAWGAVLGDVEFGDGMLISLIGTDVGLITSAFLVSPLVGLEPSLLGWASIGGIGLSTVATLLTYLGTTNSDVLVTVNLIASGVGLIGGGLLADRLLDRKSAPKETASAGGGFGFDPRDLRFGVMPAISSAGEVDGAMVVIGL